MSTAISIQTLSIWPAGIHTPTDRVHEQDRPADSPQRLSDIEVRGWSGWFVTMAAPRMSPAHNSPSLDSSASALQVGAVTCRSVYEI